MTGGCCQNVQPMPQFPQCGPGCGEGSSGSSFSSLFNCGPPKNRAPNPKTSCSPQMPLISYTSSSFMGSHCESFGTITEEGSNSCPKSEDSCPCGSSSESESSTCCSEDDDELVQSEIAATNKPYKEIEAVINNNRMVVRMQSEKPPDFEPECDCLTNPSPPSALQDNSCCSKPPEQNTCCGKPSNPCCSESTSRSHDVIFQKAEGYRTINVFPHPDPKPATPVQTSEIEITSKQKRMERKQGIVLPPVNPEDNPNIFVLRIKRKCKKGDKVHSNLNLEFKTPRPWKIEKVPEKLCEDVEEEEGEDKDKDAKSMKKGKGGADGEDSKSKAGSNWITTRGAKDICPTCADRKCPQMEDLNNKTTEQKGAKGKNGKNGKDAESAKGKNGKDAQSVKSKNGKDAQSVKSKNGKDTESVKSKKSKDAESVKSKKSKGKTEIADDESCESDEPIPKFNQGVKRAFADNCPHCVKRIPKCPKFCN